MPPPYTEWTLITLFVAKIVIFVVKRPKINEKEAGDGPFLKNFEVISSNHGVTGGSAF